MYLNYWDDFLINITDNNIQTLIDLDKWHKLIAHSGPLAPTPGKHQLTLLDVVKWPGLKWEEQSYSFMYSTSVRLYKYKCIVTYVTKLVSPLDSIHFDFVDLWEEVSGASPPGDSRTRGQSSDCPCPLIGRGWSRDPNTGLWLAGQAPECSGMGGAWLDPYLTSCQSWLSC